jgi:uncharacterized protein with NRDE domain
MCLIVFSYRQRDDYPLVLAANRDEFYQRPTAALDYWKDRPDILAGRDLQGNGTWLGITRSGRMAAVTNYRDPAVQLNGAPSRGLLVSDFLAGALPAEAYLEKIRRTGDRYNGFNLLLGDESGLWYYSNRGTGIHELTPGLYGLSNHLLNTDWPKLTKARVALGHLLACGGPLDIRGVLHLLQDRIPAPDADLPDTGVGLDWERVLSSVFITGENYGTRSSSVLSMENSGWISFLERPFEPGPNGPQPAESRRFMFKLPD